LSSLGTPMSTISTLHFNWIPQPSLYAQARDWTARQQALRQQADDLATASNTFASAATDQTTGMMNLTARAALNRVRAAAKAKSASVLNSATDTANSSSKSSSSSSLTLRDGTVIKYDPTIYLPGGSKLNLDAGTLTLSNGTVIDTATGSRKINLTV
jgi:hypothetical protein